MVLGYSGLCVALHLLGRVVEKKYGHFFKTEEHGVANRIVSSIHASTLGLIALRQMLLDFDPKQGLLLIPIHPPPMRAVESLSAQLMLGYLLYDTVLVGAVMKSASFPFAMLGHHILGALSWGSLLATGEGGNYILWVHLAELSTPFLNLGWALHSLGQKGLPAVLAGLVTVSLFLVFRIINVPLCLYSLWTYRHLFVKSFFPMQFGICLFFWLLNVFWIRQLIAVALKALGGGKERKKPAQE